MNTFSSHFLSRLLLSISLFSLPFVVSGIDPRTSANILDRFKEQQKELIFQTIPTGSGTMENIFASELRLNGIQSLMDRISTLQSQYQGTREGLSLRRMSLEQMIQTLDSQIEDSSLRIRKTEVSIARSHVDMARTNREIISTRATIARNKSIILEYLAYIYSQGNTMYDESNQIDTVKMLLLNEGNIDAIITDITYKGLVSQVGQSYIEDYRKNVKNLYVLNLRISEQTKSLKSLHQTLEYEKKMLESKKSDREKLLEVTKGQESLYEKYIASQLQAKQSLEQEWKKTKELYEQSIEEVKKTNGCDTVEKQNTELCQEVEMYFQRERELRSLTLSGSNPLEWPVENRRITAIFHDAGYFEALGSHHDAIDIAAPQGSEVRAVADGYVSYILPPTPTGYAYLSIRHADGFSSVYGHMSEISVEKYGFVRAGDIIGRSGGAPGTPGAGPMTTGAHLHFELWKDQEPIDPLRFLTIIDIAPESLPSRYLQKFTDDLILSSSSGSLIHESRQGFIIRGDTTDDRQKYLLSTYAAPSFQDWDSWVQEAIEAKLQPSFLMCVALAETSLGYRLKTAYNVGNVGNTDSGDVMYFSSASEGIRAMTKTFNNKYLGKYTKLSELSRWGNTKGPIYASSSENWHNNIVKCVSALEGEMILDTYDFRLAE